MTRQEVALELGITSEMVKQIEFKALRKMRTKLLKLGDVIFWRSYLQEIKELDPTECYCDNNSGL